MARRLALALRRVALRTQRTPLRAVWRLAYRAVALGVAAHLRRGQPGVSAYLTGSLASGDPIYGVSDIDIAVVLPAGEEATAAREVVAGRWERLRSALPTLGELLVYVATYEQREVEAVAAAPILTHGLSPGGGGERDTSHAEQLGRHALGLAQRPGPFGPFADWRRLSGPDRLPAPAWNAQELRIAAWLELQAWWGYTFGVCVDPRGPRTAYLCLKMVSEPLRILAFLAAGERHFERKQALRRAAELLPEHREAADWALALGRRLHRSPEPPLTEAVPHLLALSAAIARRLESELAGAGATEVRLAWGGSDELAIAAGARQHLRPLLAEDPALMPLVDWRSLVRPAMPDDAFALTGADPRDPAVLAAAAAASRRAPYLALSAEGLLILPDENPGRARLRAVQCSLTDPVSCALAAGRRVASFPAAAGWSARDWARRAVADHRPRVVQQAPDSPGATLGLLLSAARAAMLLESLDGREPELALTAAAVSERLGWDALGAYLDWRAEGREPAAGVVAGLREAVLALGAYRAGTR